MGSETELNGAMQLGDNAAMVVQQMLCRKKLLASQNGGFSMQDIQPLNKQGSVASSTGGLEQNIAAMLTGAQLTQEQTELVTNVVQQVLAQHVQPSQAAKSSAAATSNETFNSTSTDAQHQGQYIQSTHGTDGTDAPSSDTYMHDITAAEQALEQELQQLQLCSSLHTTGTSAAPQAAAATAVPLVSWNRKRTSAGSSGAASAADPYAASNSVSREGSCSGAAAAAANAVPSRGTGPVISPADAAQALDAALEDPNASVEDIVGILNYVLDLSTGRNSTCSGPAGTGANNPEADIGAKNACSACQDPATPRTEQQNSSASNNTETPAQMAARLMEQARAMHAVQTGAPITEGAVRAMSMGGVHDTRGGAAQQAAKQNMQVWNAEGGLMYSRTAAAGSAAAAVGSWGVSVPRSASPNSPKSGSYAEKAAGRAAARRAMSPLNALSQQQDGQVVSQLSPAGIEQAWRKGLRSGAAGPEQQQEVADADCCAAAVANYAGMLAGWDGVDGPQEWLGYDGLLGLQLQEQQQQQAGKSAKSSSGGGSGASNDVNGYRAKNTPELDAKLQRLYKRNVDWRQRCELVYARQRHAEQQEELNGCTFRPEINKRSEKIAQKTNMRYPTKPIRPQTPLADATVQQQQQQKRPASTGRMGLKRTPEPQQQQQQQQKAKGCSQQLQEMREQHAAALRAAAAAAAVLGEEAGRELMERMLSSSRDAMMAAAAAAEDSFTFSPPHNSTGGGDIGRNSKQACGRSVSPAAAVPAAARRLYEDAFVKQERLAKVVEVTKKTERKARSWSAPRSGAFRDIVPRVYNHLMEGVTSPRAVHQHLQTGLEECTFHPQTNNSSGSKYPGRPATASAKSAPGASEAAAGAHQEAAVDVDSWEKLLERQRNFLLLRQAKQAAVAAEMTAAKKKLELSPGSKRILKEKQKMEELRSSAGSLGAAYEQRQQQHVTAQVLPSSLCYQQECCTDSSSPLLRSSSNNAMGNHATLLNASSPSGSHSSAGSPYLNRVQQQLQHQGSSSAPGSPAGSTGSPVHQSQTRASMCSSGSAEKSLRASVGDGQGQLYKPAITRKAAAKKPRSVEEMSEGDRLRREAKLEQLRIMAEARSLAGVTFAPDMSPTRSRPGSGYYESVKPRISLKPEGLEAYMSSLEQKRREKEERRKKVEQQRKEAELAECTFKPVTTPVPAYLSAMSDVGYTARFIEARLADAMAQPFYPAVYPHEKQA